ncbi:MAG: cadherin-like beta sandwich domain-containing protein [Firmicutes bacterium]|nr:cadherin-like beta sandwich domain-containing protein [Bacillota bacterium]
MDINENNEELKKDLEEQYAMLETEIEEDKKKKRYLILLICFLFLFLFMFGTTFSYFQIYIGNKQQQVDEGLKNLYVEKYEDAYVFDKNVYEYTVFVKEGTKSVNTKYVLSCEKCNVKIEGQDDLKFGDNKVKVTVINDKTGKVEEYIIHVIVPQTVEETNLDLISLSVLKHDLSSPFRRDRILYLATGIKTSEDITVVNFELFDKNNKVEVKLNGYAIGRPLVKQRDIYRIWFDVKKELHIGSNKLEIIVKDNNGNSKSYYLYLEVSEDKEIEQKVVEISVEYPNATPSNSDKTPEEINEDVVIGVDGSILISDIVPGWESNKQQITVTNSSTYNTNIDFKWSNVDNGFERKEDLEFYLYKDDELIKTGILPANDKEIITNMLIPANSINRYYMIYKYKYSEEDQNIDQGKEFSAKINVVISK